MRLKIVSFRHFLWLSLIPLCLTATPALAAQKACKEGVKATIEGQVRSWVDLNDRLWVMIADPSWDCLHFVIAVKKAQGKACQVNLGGIGRATGIMTRKDRRNANGEWTVTDEGSGGNGPGLTSTFSCSPRAGNSKTKSGNK